MDYVHLLLPDFTLILCGYLLCRFTVLNRTVWTQIDNLVFYLLLPVLAFHAIVRRPIEFAGTSKFILAALLLVAVVIGLSYALGLSKLFKGRNHAASAQIAFRFNSVIALAVSERLAGVAGLQAMAIVMGICVPICNTAAVWAMAREGQEKFWRVLATNPIVIATAGGLLANVLGFSIPAWAEIPVTRIDQAALAMGLMAAGAGLQFKALGHAPALGVSMLSIRHLLAPLIGFGLMQLLGLTDLQATIFMAFSGMPTAPSSYVLAARMGYNGPYVAALVTISTLLAMLSLPFALGLLH